MADYEGVIGLEIHVQLKTESKLFCQCPAEYGGKPNSRVCPICLGLPGALPALNRAAVEYAVRMALALNCNVNSQSAFARKNYFYPDLPKGYQISQYEFPLAENGSINILGEANIEKNIRVSRIHLEEEAGKSFHDMDNRHSFIDYNRCGVPLIEIVTEPDLGSGEEAYALLNKIKRIAEYLDITTGNMDQGALRCDVNISIRRAGDTGLSTRREIKNMNSFKFARKAIDYEIFKQMEIIGSGGKVLQQTMLWDEKTGITMPMRAKEEMDDYRYFPEPDLKPLEVSLDWINEISRNLPELPDEKLDRFVKDYKLTADKARALIASPNLADYYEKVVNNSGDPVLSANWILTELLREIKETDIEHIKLKPENLGELIKIIKSGQISSRIAKDLFKQMITTGRAAGKIENIVKLNQISDKKQLGKIVENVLSLNQNHVKMYLSGKERLFGYFMGQVMDKTDGRANPGIVRELLTQALKYSKGQ
ncbi:MAG: Asp-tRNA(Asn)/Glu-tRNA(Gln) amidotransferase subunit GatB [candidate division Zixibacteria bacterium]|nr:Asp-tRNA(Asn)/Glu-tRNA(Gln) amidotransferase subunit GatB [candidate division Zixibacteria bacterium]